MKLTRLRMLGIVAAVSAGSVLSACGSSNEPQKGADNPKQPEAAPITEPVKITMYNHFNNISPERLQQFIIEPLKQKLPLVTLEVVKHDKGTTIEELVASNNFTDFYYGSNVGFPTYQNLQLQYDMNELIKKHKLDLNRIDPVYMDAVKMFGGKGEVYGVPFSANVGVMIYNKDIFDKFGVAYPTDGMTWDEVVKLSPKLTRSDGGINYIGFDPGRAADIASGLSLPYADANTKKALIDSDGWRKVFNLFKDAYSVPGYVQEGKFEYYTNGFYKDKQVAMLPVWSLGALNMKDELAKMNWDFVSLPGFNDTVGRGRMVDIHMLAVSSVSKNKDAALEVLKVITSDEVQKLMSEYGTISVLKNDEIQKAYGSKLPEYKGKNIQALFKTKPGLPNTITKYDGPVNFYVEAGRKDIAAGTDVNTVIRTIQEKSDAKLAEQQ